jgi:uncharacterized lipoprotein YddW (UPF0748 family)
MVPLLMLIAMLIAVAAGATQVQVIDNFEYADAAALQAVWAPAEESVPAQLMAHPSGGGQWALKMPCNFPQENVNRAVYDGALKLDLSRYGTIRFDFYADDPAPIRSCTIYFHSGNGWYGAGFGAEPGWNRISIGKGTFKTEGTPAGWDQVDTVRICAWKGTPKETFCAVDNLAATSEDLVLVAGGSGTEQRTAADVAKRCSGYLDKLGVPHTVLTDSDVAGGALAGKKLAVLCYNPGISDDAVAQVVNFVATGGRVIVFYNSNRALLDLLGVANMVYKGRTVPGQYASVSLEGAPPGTPPSMGQDTWNINSFAPGGHRAKVVGWWTDLEGKRGDPAVLISENGAYMGHILTGSDPENQGMFLVALIAEFLPEVWQQAAEAALSLSTVIGPFKERAALLDFLRTKAPAASQGKINSLVAQADQCSQDIEGLLAARRYTEVLDKAAQMRSLLSEAYSRCHASRDGEFRAVWNHSGTGDCGTWDEAMRRLSEANFNAVVPNMWWGGIAHYDSKLLPLSATFRERGDQIAQCVAAGKKYGVEVHPWKVNWNLSTAPQSFVDQMRAEGRLQKTAGGEEGRWLCPSDPRNFELERDTMLEVVRNYDVDGIHFDYIRYPDGDSCYCDGCRERFEKLIGQKVANWPRDCYSGDLKAQYRQFRCDNITRLVKAVSEESRKIKPWVKISAAVFSSYPGCKNDVGQDWVLWCKEGYLDFVCPMNYFDSDSTFRNTITRQVGYVGEAVPIYSGIGGFIIPDDQAIGQVQIARAAGADGFIVFNMGEGLARNGLPRFAMGVTSEKATLPHNAPALRFANPADDDSSPVVKLTGDSTTFSLTMAGPGHHRSGVRDLTFRIEQQDLSGALIARLDGPNLENGKLTREVDRSPGVAVFRLAAVGEMTLDDGTHRTFIVRSRPYQFAER